MGKSIMKAIVGFLAQKMIGGLGQGGGGGIDSMISGVTGVDSGSRTGGIGSILFGLGGLNNDHELVRHVQQNTVIQDPEQARQYYTAQS
jgi:hypothetical protein